MTSEERLARQLKREDASEKAGRIAFNKQEKKNDKIANASSNTFGVALIRARHETIIENIIKIVEKEKGTKVKERADAISRCVKLDHTGKAHPLMNIEIWAYLGYQAVIDNIFNPNLVDTKEINMFGVERTLLAKKDLSELELFVGKQINQQMALKLIQLTFPNWFRVHDGLAKKRHKDGMRSNPSYYNKRMIRSINKFAEKLEAEGKTDEAQFLRTRKAWTNDECRIIGELVVEAVLMANADIFAKQWTQNGKKKRWDIVLTPGGEHKANQLKEQMASFAHDLLPMLVEPNPVTNESLGGWYKDVLQEEEYSPKGSIELSDKHLEFINRQSKTKFEINPFIHQLLQRLVDEQKPLGKFDYQVPDSKPSAAAELGVAAVIDPEERDRLIKGMSAEAKKNARHATELSIERQFQQSMRNVVSERLLRMTNQVADDDYNFIPMKPCFRGRVYSRVPFLSFQGTDVGKYLLRFHEKTPKDNRTRHWMRIGLANAAGQDKKTFEQRTAWFNKNKEQVFNVGRMLSGGNFDEAYAFLKDEVDDPFCFAALANEYVKVFVDKTQDYVQCFVLVDASCSGTSIFNAWRRNKEGALKTNLIDTPQMNDIYMAVWEKIKELAPEKAFRKVLIKRLENSKLLRKMMKEVYVPASYASPPGEQLQKLKKFNQENLIPAGIGFKDAEMQELLKIWAEALDAVSSINTVVNWFKERTKEALANGAKEIYVRSSNGSLMTLKYPKSTMKRVTVLGNADVRSRRKSLTEYKDEPFVKKLLNSVTANVTHFTDSSILVEALWDAEMPFVGVHDAVGVPCSSLVDDAIDRLRMGFKTATEHNIWDNFRQENGIKFTPENAAPIVGDLDMDEILKSTYLFS